METTQLPVVNREVALSMHHEMGDMEHWATNYIKQVQEKNPIIAEFLTSYAKDLSPKAAIRSIWVGLVVYRFLEVQAESNALEAVIGD